ncbi:hypothetical protein FF1_031292 [Malus domestica]
MTGLVMLTRGGGCGGGGGGNGEGDKGATKSSEEEQNQISLVALLLAAVRKSMVACRVKRGEEVISARPQHGYRVAHERPAPYPCPI